MQSSAERGQCACERTKRHPPEHKPSVERRRLVLLASLDERHQVNGCARDHARNDREPKIIHSLDPPNSTRSKMQPTIRAIRHRPS
ncbi:MAG: hypothetical protein E6Q97_35990 [Desulfurellales bacterium]|nr:MAG: hypothetical protein E6Q97_35990 [Desulfurellales bacterium]